MRKVLFRKYSPTIGAIVLNNDNKKNAMDEELAEAFAETVGFIVKDSSDLNLVLVEGAGEVFSSGGDLDMLLRKTREDPVSQWSGMVNYYSAFASVLDIPVPVVAMIQGWCVGAAMSLAALCDIRIAFENARFSVPFLKLGLYPGLGSTWLIPEMLGSFGEYMLLTGETVPAQRLLELGFVHRLIQAEEKLTVCGQIEQIFAKIPRKALQFTLSGLRLRKKQALLGRFEFEARSQSICYSSDWFKMSLEQKKRG